MRFFKFGMMWIAASLFLLLSGCGGHGGGGFTANNFTLKSNVVELDKTGTVVVSVNANTVVLTGAPTLDVGQIIIHNALDGTRFLRKVESSVVNGGTTTVTTSDAGVEDVFDKAQILQQSPVKSDDLLTLQPAMPGVAFVPSSGPGRAAGDNSIQINFSGMELKDDSNNAIAQIDGSITLAAGIETKFVKSGLSVTEFEVAPYASVNGTLTARGRASGSFTKEFPISLNLRIPVTPLGPLGVNCDVQLMMKVEGSYSAEGQFVVTAGVSAKEGIHYASNGGWTLINDFQKSFNITPPSLRASLEMGVSLVRPKIAADILGIGEVHVTADVLKIIGRVTGQTQPVPGFQVECLGDFAFDVGGSVKLGPLTLWNDSRTFGLGQFSIMKSFMANLGPTQTYIAFPDTQLRNIHAFNGDGTGDHIILTSTTALYAPSISNQSGKLCYGKFNSSGRGEIWTANSDGTGQRKITDGTLSINHPTWNPAGTEIAFDANDSNSIKQIYVVNVSSGNIRQLTSDPTASRIPTWNADASQIYFEHISASLTKVIARTSSATPTYDVVLADDTTTYQEPSLSPNGLQLVCLRGGSEIVVSDEQGRGEHVVLADSHLSRPTWSPDGLRLIMQYNDVGTTTIQSYNLDGLDGKNYAAGLQPTWGLRH